MLVGMLLPSPATYIVRRMRPQVVEFPRVQLDVMLREARPAAVRVLHGQPAVHDRRQQVPMHLNNHQIALVASDPPQTP